MQTNIVCKISINYHIRMLLPHKVSVLAHIHLVGLLHALLGHHTRGVHPAHAAHRATRAWLHVTTLLAHHGRAGPDLHGLIAANPHIWLALIRIKLWAYNLKKITLLIEFFNHFGSLNADLRSFYPIL